MAGIEIRQRGKLLDGSASRAVPSVVRSWTQGTLRLFRDYARSIAPVKTGVFRSSITYRTEIRNNLVEGQLSSTDVAGKTRSIEYGFPPARPDLMGRQGVYVFRRTFEKGQGLLRSQERVLEANLARELSR
jgi:hypothetical protein